MIWNPLKFIVQSFFTKLIRINKKYRQFFMRKLSEATVYRTIISLDKREFRGRLYL